MDRAKSENREGFEGAGVSRSLEGSEASKSFEGPKSSEPATASGGSGSQGSAEPSEVFTDSKTHEAPEVLEAQPAPGVLSGPPFQEIAEVVRNFRAVSHALVDPLCRAYGLNRLGLFILLNLEKMPDESPSELSAALHARRTNVTSALRNLEHKGLVSIGVSEQDRRHRLVNLTDKGARMAAEIQAQLDEARDLLLVGIPEESLRALDDGWAAFRAAAAHVAAEVCR